MKYRVKHIVTVTRTILFLNIYSTEHHEWIIQYKKHWWNRWKTCDRYDRIEDAYIALLDYETDHHCQLPLKMNFPYNKIKGKTVECDLILYKDPTPKYENGQYHAGYKPKNYHNFYYCVHDHSFENVIYKLWAALETQKIIKLSNI